MRHPKFWKNTTANKTKFKIIKLLLTNKQYDSYDMIVFVTYYESKSLR